MPLVAQVRARDCGGGCIDRTHTYRDVRSHADPNLTAILVANKVDLCEQSDADGAAVGSARREVSREEAEQWAKEEDMLFIEASAKSGANVDAVRALLLAARATCASALTHVLTGVRPSSPGHLAQDQTRRL